MSKAKPKETGSDLDVPEIVTSTYIEKLVAALKEQKRLQILQINQILIRIRRILDALPNVLEVNVPEGIEITLVGDTHGQFFDVLHIFEINGAPSDQNPYLFNGDWVDRGSFGSEICLLLFIYKLMNPNCIHLIRGNHESQQCTEDYGFKEEILDKYNQTVYNNFIFIFNALPIASILNKDVFVVHGGLFAEEGVKIADINKINRKVEPGVGEDNQHKYMAQMLWADPVEENGTFETMRPYGCGFGPDVTAAFLRLNKLKLVVRSHQVRSEGFKVEHHGQLITLFSAPSYCGEDNKGAFVRLRSLPTSTSNLTEDPASSSSSTPATSLTSATSLSQRPRTHNTLPHLVGSGPSLSSTSPTSAGKLSSSSSSSSSTSHTPTLGHSLTLSTFVRSTSTGGSSSAGPSSSSSSSSSKKGHAHGVSSASSSASAGGKKKGAGAVLPFDEEGAGFKKVVIPPGGRIRSSSFSSDGSYRTLVASSSLSPSPSASLSISPSPSHTRNISGRHNGVMSLPVSPSSSMTSLPPLTPIPGSPSSSSSSSSLCSPPSSFFGSVKNSVILEEEDGETELLPHAVFTSSLYPELSIYQFPKSHAPPAKEYFKPTLRKEFW